MSPVFFLFLSLSYPSSSASATKTSHFCPTAAHIIRASLWYRPIPFHRHFPIILFSPKFLSFTRLDKEIPQFQLLIRDRSLHWSLVTGCHGLQVREGRWNPQTTPQTLLAIYLQLSSSKIKTLVLSTCSRYSICSEGGRHTVTPIFISLATVLLYKIHASHHCTPRPTSSPPLPPPHRLPVSYPTLDRPSPLPLPTLPLLPRSSLPLPYPLLTTRPHTPHPRNGPSIQRPSSPTTHPSTPPPTLDMLLGITLTPRMSILCSVGVSCRYAAIPSKHAPLTYPAQTYTPTHRPTRPLTRPSPTDSPPGGKESKRKERPS